MQFMGLALHRLGKDGSGEPFPLPPHSAAAQAGASMLVADLSTPRNRAQTGAPINAGFVAESAIALAVGIEVSRRRKFWLFMCWLLNFRC